MPAMTVPPPPEPAAAGSGFQQGKVTEWMRLGRG